MRSHESSAATGKAPVKGPEVANSNEWPVESLESGPIRADMEEVRVARERTAAMLRFLWDRRQLVLRLAGAGLALSTMIAFLIPKRFESTTRLMPPDQTNSGVAMLAAAATSPSGSGLGSSLGGVAGDLLGLKSSGALFIGILQSRTVQDDLVNKFDLRKIYRDRQFVDARRELSGNTGVSEDRKSGILTIQVTDKSPQRASAMAQEYVEELNSIVTQLNTSSAHRERIFLEERLAQVKQDLEAAEKRFSEYASKNTAIDIQAQGKAMIEAAATLEGQLIAARTELESMKQVYTGDNVRVRATQARVDELQRELQRLGGKYDVGTVATPENDKSMYPSIRELPLLGVSYADLYRTTKVQEAIFGTLTQEYELAKVQEAKETPSVKVIDPPDVPERKSFPPRLEIIVLGTVLGTVMGVVWVFACSTWDKTDPQDPHKVLAVEVYQVTKAHFPWTSHNGFSVGAVSRRLWSQLRRRQLDRV